MSNGDEAARGTEASLARIYAAAEEEFGRSGYGRTSVQSIASRAGVSKELIYHYFQRKDALYSETINRFGMAFWRHLLATRFRRPDPVAALHEFVRRVGDFYHDNSHAAHFLIDQVFERGKDFRAEPRQIELRKHLFAELDSVLERGRQAGLIDPAMTASRLFFLAVGMTIGDMTVGALLPAFALSPDEQRNARLRVPDLIVRLASLEGLGSLSAVDGPMPS